MCESEHARRRLLESAVSWQKRPRQTAQRLGDISKTYLQHRSSRLKKNAQIADIWQGLLPAELAKRSRPAGISRSVLIIEAEPGPYMFQLKNIKQELLSYLQQQCPSAKIRDIRLKTAESAESE